MQASRTKNAARNAISGIINRIVGLLIPFILRTALIKVLGEQYLGLSNLFSSILQVLNLADLGFGTAITYSMYKPIADGDDKTICALVNLYRRIYVIIGLGILVIGLCLIPFLNNFIKGSYPKDLNLVVLYLMYLFNTVCSYLFFAHRQSLMSAFQRNDISTNVNSIIQLIFNVAKLILLFAWKNYYVYIFFVPATTLVSGLISAAISYKMFPQYKAVGHLSRSMTRGIMKRTSALVVQKFGGTISTSLDSIVVSSFLGLSAVAVYGNYFYIVSSLLSFVWVAVSATTAGLGNSMVTESPTKNYSLFKQMNMMNQWVITWVVPCLLCLYQPFMLLWVGSSMTYSYVLVVCMVLYFYITETRKVVQVFKDAAGMWWADKWKPLVGCIVNLAFNLISVRYIGMNGVILSTVISYTFIEMPWETWVLFHIYFKGFLRDYFFDLLKHLLVIIIASALSLLAMLLISSTGWLALFTKGIMAFMISNLVFFTLFFRNITFKQLARRLLKS